MDSLVFMIITENLWERFLYKMSGVSSTLYISALQLPYFAVTFPM